MTCFIDGFNAKMKSQPVAYLCNGNEHIGFWAWKAKCTQIWDSWLSGLQERKGDGFSKVGRAMQKFSVRSSKSRYLSSGVALARMYLPQKTLWGRFWANLCYGP
jgi:hypothetical protein